MPSRLLAHPPSRMPIQWPASTVTFLARYGLESKLETTMSGSPSPSSSATAAPLLVHVLLNRSPVAPEASDICLPVIFIRSGGCR